MYPNHNLFQQDIDLFYKADPHLLALSQLKYQYMPSWWQDLSFSEPGIYILTGGRQVGKSTSCKLLIKSCLENKVFPASNILYLPCDEIFTARELSQIIRDYLDSIENSFLLIIDEITFIVHWERVIKALADEGYFQRGLCLLTGSDTLILKDAAICFPGRRGKAAQTDFHLYPLSFNEYVKLRANAHHLNDEQLYTYYRDYLQCGGYLRAINDLAQLGKVSKATMLTYEQWIRGDFLKRGKNENYLLVLLHALLTVGVSQISYSRLTQKMGLMSKETCIEYINLLERMDVLIDVPAFDQNKMQGFPRKDRKFHIVDPFIYQTLIRWLEQEGYTVDPLESTIVEACVASHCRRQGRVYYHKGKGEVDVIWLKEQLIQAIEIKWAKQIRSEDLKMLKQFNNSLILGKNPQQGQFEHIPLLPVYRFLYEM